MIKDNYPCALSTRSYFNYNGSLNSAAGFFCTDVKNVPAKLALVNHKPKLNGSYNNEASTNKTFFNKNCTIVTSLTLRLTTI